MMSFGAGQLYRRLALTRVGLAPGMRLLEVTFLEFARVLKPGGRLLILEISRPRSLIARSLLQLYLGRVLPLVVRIGTGHRNAELLVKYYWETIAECVSVEKIVEIVQAS